MHFTRNTKKIRTNSFMATTALGLTLVAGMPSSVMAEPDRATRHTNMSEHQNADEQLLHYARSSELIGAELYNKAGDPIGTMSDYIVDRGSGQIVYGIVTTGDILGFGGKEIALGYDEVRYVPVGKSFNTMMTKQELTRRTEYLPENWDDLNQTSWMDKLGNWVDGDSKAKKSENAMREAARNGEQAEVEGKITKVTRERVMGEEYVCATIRDESGTDRKVLIGPCWFINGADYAIHRDDEADLRVAKHGDKWIALRGELNGNNVDYRDKDGNGRWVSNRAEQPRYVLLSELTGDSIEMTGSTVGEIQTTIVEGGSGQIAFIGLDPNENIFGLGDEISLVPWQSLSMIDDSTYTLDSNEAELAKAMAMPENLDTLRLRETTDAAYKVFGQDTPDFSRAAKISSTDRQRTKTDMNDRMADRTGDAWARDSKMVRAFTDGDSVKLEGKFMGMDSKRVVDGAPAATVLLIQTEDGTKTVIVGPEWFTKRQKIDLDTGDRIVVHARTTKMDSKTWHAAESIDHDGNQWVFWDDDTPMWTN